MIVSFYTPDYREVVKGLIGSLKKFKLDYDVEEIESLGSWDLNCNHKASFLLRKLKEHQTPVIWVDADAVVRKYPTYFDVIQEDIGVHYENMNSLKAGVVFVNNTEPAKKVLERWKKNSETQPKIFDQKHLQSVLRGEYIETHNATVFFLPDSYYHIFDIHKGEPVLEHYQESRRFRRKYGV